MFPKSSRTFFWQNSSLVDGSGGFSIIGSPQSNFFVVSSRTIFNRRMCKREANDEHAMKPIAALWKRNDAADPGHDTSKSSAIPADSVGFWWVGVVVFFQIFWSSVIRLCTELWSLITFWRPPELWCSGQVGRNVFTESYNIQGQQIWHCNFVWEGKKAESDYFGRGKCPVNQFTTEQVNIYMYRS